MQNDNSSKTIARSYCKSTKRQSKSSKRLKAKGMLEQIYKKQKTKNVLEIPVNSYWEHIFLTKLNVLTSVTKGHHFLNELNVLMYNQLK